MLSTDEGKVKTNWVLASKDKKPSDLGRVAVLMGGDSAEREISLVTGANILAALQRMGVDAYGIDVRDDIIEQLRSNRPDRVFIALHGPGGEDGVIQGLLEWMKIPYSGSDVASSALTMNKIHTKYVWECNGIPTPPMVIVDHNPDYRAAAEKIGLPLCIKPSNEGSSFGVTRVDEWSQFDEAIEKARQFNFAVMIEPWIEGRELTVGIIGDYALPIIEIRPKLGVYDYTSKYVKGSTEYLCPAPISDALSSVIRSVCLRAFELTGCRGWGRLDLMLDNQDKFWLLELNSIPGMTETSLVPKAAKAEGVNFEQLVYEIIWLSVAQ
jgi:D-alanine-D-alanine ligase